MLLLTITYCSYNLKVSCPILSKGKTFTCIIFKLSLTYFSSWLKEWDSRCVPHNRIILDEIQDSGEGVPARREKTYQPLMQKLKEFNVQLIMLTATMPDYLRADYRQLFDREDFTLFSESSDRPNVGYHFGTASEVLTQKAKKDYSKYQYQDVVQNLICKLIAKISSSTSTHDHILVFFSTPDIIQSFAEGHGYLWHNSTKTHTGLQATLDAWDAHQSKVLVGTTSLAQGVNRDSVCYVIVANVYYGHTILVQMLGRAGRNGGPSDLFFIGPYGANTIAPFTLNKPGVAAQHNLNAYPGCQRKFSMVSMDGPDHPAYSCLDPPDLEHGPVQPCGNCAPASALHQLFMSSVVKATATHIRSQPGSLQSLHHNTKALHASSSTSSVI